MLLGLASGGVGVWASFQRNTFAAKLFLWSWPANFALSMVSWIIWWLAIEQLTNYGLSASQLMPTTFTFLVSSINLYFLVYFTKVLKRIRCIASLYYTKNESFSVVLLRLPWFTNDPERSKVSYYQSSTSLMVGVPQFHGMSTFDHVILIGVLVILRDAEGKGYECIVQQYRWRRAPWTQER